MRLNLFHWGLPSNLMEVCEQEEKALEYFAGQLSESEQIKVEAHIAECHKCCQMVANLTKTTFSEETVEEKIFLEAQTREVEKKVRLLVKESLGADTEENTGNIAPFPVKANDKRKSNFSKWRNSPITIAASITLLILIGALVLVMLQNKIISSQIAQSIVDLKEINSTGRPTSFRLDGFDYAPVAKSRDEYFTKIQFNLRSTKATLEKAVTSKPTAENLNLLAQAFIMSGEYDQAIEKLSQAIILNPKDPMIVTNLAVAYAVKEDYQNALVKINLVLNTNENYLPGIFNRALIYQELKQYDKARSDWEKYLNLDSRSFWSVEAQKYLLKIQ